MARHLPRYVIYQLYATLGFILLFALLIALGENAMGWHGLSYLIAAVGIAGLWAFLSAICMVRIIIRERGRQPCWPAISILLAILALIGLLGIWLGT